MAIKKTEYLKFGENLYEVIPPFASEEDRGGIIASPKTETDTVEIKLGVDGKLYAPETDLTDYYNKAENDEQLSKKANKEHSHEINNINGLQDALDSKSDNDHNHDEKYDALGSANKALSSANEHTDTEIADLSARVAYINTTSNENVIDPETGTVTTIAIDSALSSISTNPVQNKVIKAELDKKADNSSLPTKTSQLINDSGYITSIPNEYVTDTELNTEIGKFGGTVEITSGNPEKENTVVTIDPDAEEVVIYTANEVDAMVEELEGQIGDRYTKNESDNKYQPKGNYLTEIPAAFATEDEVDAKITDLKAQGVQQTPLFANSVAECTDTTKVYVLPDGYIYAYVKKDKEASEIPNFTNQIPISTDTDGSVYNGKGYKENAYLSSGNEGTRTDNYCTGFISIGCGSSRDASGEQVVRLSGISAELSTFRLALYKSDKSYINQLAGSQFGTGGGYNEPIPYEVDTNNYLIEFDITSITACIRDDAAAGETAFIRFSCPAVIDSNSVVTVNEEITYTTTEGGIYYEWTNTGHAFVPTDYEERIVDAEESISKNKTDIVNLKNTTTTLKTELADIKNNGVTVSEGVQTSASALVNKALSRGNGNVFRFIISTDAHHKVDDELISKGTRELGQAHGEVLKLIGVDLVANLGDITWGSSDSDNATVLEEGKAFNRYMLDNIRGQTQIWTEGNHETDKLTESQIRALIYCHNKGLVYDADNWFEGYGYMDFPQGVRVICLNTDQHTGNDSSGVSDTQVKWFAEVALNVPNNIKHVITMGHHPLSYNNITMVKNCAYTVEAFINKDNFSLTTNGGTTITADYTNKSCKYIGHFHGHAHAFSVVKMQKYVSSGVYEEFDAWEICVPNACYSRNNQYLNNAANPYVTRYSTETTYNKSDEDGLRTSFNLVTVDLDNKIIYADNYGAGIDRIISYTDYENATYTITRNLTNCVSSSGINTVTENSSHTETLIGNSVYYTLEGGDITITMGGVDITDSVYNGGVISIANVTGDIVITASAVEQLINWLPLATTTVDDDTIFGDDYNGDGMPDGYQDGLRWSSSSGITNSGATGSQLTGIIASSPNGNNLVRIKNVTSIQYFLLIRSDGRVVQLTPTDGGYAEGYSQPDDNGVYTFYIPSVSTIINAGCRFSAKGINNNTIITVDQEIPTDM